MKTSIFFWGIIFLIVAGCNQKKAESAKHEHEDTTATMKQGDHDEAMLTLNDGKKWKIDDATRVNIDLIKQSFQKYAAESKPDHLALGTELQGNADKLVSECKMTGKDHEMLHVWLGKFLSSIRKLKSSEIAIQQTGFHETGEVIKSFDEYFE